MNMLGHALRGVESGAADVILVIGGDATGLAGYGRIAANYNIATRDHLAPLGHGGPNGVYALVAARQIKAFGLEKSDYGHIAIAQRAWAAKNPFAVYRAPLTMEEYLAAPMVADPGRASDGLLDAWVADLDSWDVCDGLCSSLLGRMPQRWELVDRYAAREAGFERRAGFALLATLAVHDKAAGDDAFRARLPLIEGAAPDPRNEVRKGVNWALRQIGKRNAALHADAIACAERILAAGPRSARWVASDALRELRARAPAP